jgi:hypothetical protein
VQGRSPVDDTTTALDRSDAVQAPERAAASATLADPTSEDSRAPLGVVIKDRRRLGRVSYHSQYLIDLLRGRSAVVESPAAPDGISEDSPLAPGAKRTGDGLSAARGIIFSTLTGAGLWAVIIWTLWRLL